MVIKVLKWGNSLGLRLPKALARDAGVEAGTEVDLTLEGDRLIIRRARSTASLADLLAGVNEANLHSETETGPPRGREIW